MNRALLLGAGGMLAHDITAYAPAHVEVVPRTRSATDITDELALSRALADIQPAVVLNCAAFTGVDAAESRKDDALAVNGFAPGILGRLAAESSARPLIVHFSTDYVFDGRAQRPYREDDPTAPLGVYGASKLVGEQRLAASGADHMIVRTQWLFGARGRSFVRTMWERAQRDQATRVVNDQSGRPTYTADLAQAVWTLLSILVPREPTPFRRTFHIANTGAATWYDLAAHVFARAGRSPLLSPCTAAEYPVPAPRPSYSVLDTSAYEAVTRTTLPDWRNAVDRLLAEVVSEKPV